MPAKKSAAPAPKPAPKPAPAPAVEEAAAPAYEVGDVLVFTGYPALEEGQEPVFAEGEYVQVIALTDTEGWYQASAVGMVEGQEEGTTREDVISIESLRDLTDEEGAEVQAQFAHVEDAEGESEAVEGEAVEGATGLAKPKKAKGAAKTKGAKVKKKLILFSGTQALIEAGEDLIQTAKQLSETAQQTWFDLGEVLVLLYEKHSYIDLLDEEGNPLYKKGKDGFSAFLDKHLNISYRTAANWMKIVKELKKIGKHDPEILSLGWAKLSHIARALGHLDGNAQANAETIKPLIEFASTATVEELNAAVSSDWVGTAEAGEGEAAATSSGPAPGDVEKRHMFRFFVIGEAQKALADSCIEAAKKATGSDSLDQAFAYILDQFAAVVSVQAETAPEAAAPVKAVVAPKPAAKKVAVAAKKSA